MKDEFYKKLVDELKAIMYEFDNKRWLKMATRTDMAKYIISKGFYPSEQTKKFKKSIERISLLLEKYCDSENGSLSAKGVAKVKEAIAEYKGEENAN